MLWWPLCPPRLFGITAVHGSMTGRQRKGAAGSEQTCLARETGKQEEGTIGKANLMSIVFPRSTTQRVDKPRHFKNCVDISSRNHQRV